MWLRRKIRIKALPAALLRGLRGGFGALRRPGGRLALQVTFTVALLAAFFAVGYFVSPIAGPSWSYGSPPERNEVTELSYFEEYVEPPDSGRPVDVRPDPNDDSDTPSPSPEESPADVSLSQWADDLSDLGISPVALEAYGRAELISQARNPGCHLSWTTLAGIGSVETNHGTTGNAILEPNGDTSDDIYGPEVVVEGERMRAAGPMQFIPPTWERWGTDGDGDGTVNVQNVFDAAVSAADYLCADGKDLRDPAQWYAAVYSYNHLDTYVHDVYERANQYGEQSK
ncbi:lytic transglycosylase domain-containing protein [Haloglycomyces albus]|uniref:lytic transglycosylase domain-containing protein n=1 Tax=Haloglycomyces albus TaxID=526067 RepID=UPI00046D764E|nr:lytic transglycosylase domain-containing protein [Haloglycomyces albus]